MLCGIEANDSPHFIVPRFDLMMDFVTSAFQWTRSKRTTHILGISLSRNALLSGLAFHINRKSKKWEKRETSKHLVVSCYIARNISSLATINCRNTLALAAINSRNSLSLVAISSRSLVIIVFRNRLSNSYI